MSRLPKLTPKQRSAAVERAGENLALVSGAGCGKTLVLGRRFTELLLRAGDAEDPLLRFVALTFTDKAALEMKHRVRRLLGDLAAAAKSDADRRRLLQWREALPAARISTIHSFCAGLLRAHAIEAGVDPAFAVCADTLLAASMIDEAAEEALLATCEAEREDALQLISQLSFDTAAGLAAQLVRKRASWSAEQYADPAATLARWQEQLAGARREAREALVADEALTREVAELAALPCDDPEDKLAAFRAPFLAAADAVLANEAEWTAEHLKVLKQKPGSAGRKAAWSAAGDVKTIRDRLKAVGARLVEHEALFGDIGPADEAAAKALAAITHLADDANRRYAADKRARGLLDFDDLLIHTHDLIRRSPELRERLATGIDQLLIDECQDTNAYQIELLLPLADPDLGEGSPSRGRLFVVGDRKQSIYRFRGAQVEEFDRLCERLGRRGREALDLSFRCHAPGAAFVNELFGPLMADYEPIESSRSEVPEGPAVEILLGEPGGRYGLDNAEQANRLQAAVTAERIQRMVEGGERLAWDAEARRWRPARYRDVAILMSRMTHSLAYERELAQRGVPYYVVAGTGFFQQQEVYDVLNALRAVDNPFDDVAFVGVLRSGLVGLDDNALMHLAAAMDPPYLPKLLAGPGRDMPGLTAEQVGTLRFAVRLLGELGRVKDAVGIGELIDRLLTATGYEAALLAQSSGRRKAGNVRRLTALARAASADGLSMPEFLATAAERVIDESRFEQAAVAGEEDDVVRLMTIHKAKGLEFPIVFVPDLNAGRQPPKGRLLLRRDWGLTLRLQADEEDEESPAKAADLPVSFRAARAAEKRDEQAEDIRRLYVALTRHQDHLVLVGANLRDREGKQFKAPRGGDCHLRRIDEVLGARAAVDAGTDLPFGDPGYTAKVQLVTPGPAKCRAKVTAPGEAMLIQAATGGELASAILSSATDATAPATLGPLPADVGSAELAVTALGDFAYCPMLYRWQHELRVPGTSPVKRAREELEPHGRQTVGVETVNVDAATIGTLFHRCMELVDFAEPPLAEAIARRALEDLDLAERVDAKALAGELDEMLARLRATPLGATLAQAAKTLRELDFVWDSGPAVLRGQIDLLYQDGGGAWHIVDYKSDRVGDEGVAAHAARYEPQMLAYAAAAERHLGRLPADATLYFLRLGETHAFPLDANALASARSRIDALARELIAARRRGDFPRRADARCPTCPYAALCRPVSGP